MAQVSQMQDGQQESRAKFFGVPVGELGWFASLLIGAAAGFAAFFLATFFGIIGILIYNSTAHATVDYALSYRRGGLVTGSVVLVAAWAYLGSLWIRRVRG